MCIVLCMGDYNSWPLAKIRTKLGSFTYAWLAGQSKNNDALRAAMYAYMCWVLNRVLHLISSTNLKQPNFQQNCSSKKRCLAF